MKTRKIDINNPGKKPGDDAGDGLVIVFQQVFIGKEWVGTKQEREEYLERRRRYSANWRKKHHAQFEKQKARWENMQRHTEVLNKAVRRSMFKEASSNLKNKLPWDFVRMRAKGKDVGSIAVAMNVPVSVVIGWIKREHEMSRNEIG